MPRKKIIKNHRGDSYEDIPRFQKMWVSDTADGHEVRIAWGGLLESPRQDDPFKMGRQKERCQWQISAQLM